MQHVQTISFAYFGTGTVIVTMTSVDGSTMSFTMTTAGMVDAVNSATDQINANLSAVLRDVPLFGEPEPGRLN